MTNAKHLSNATETLTVQSTYIYDCQQHLFLPHMQRSLAMRKLSHCLSVCQMRGL